MVEDAFVKLPVTLTPVETAVDVIDTRAEEEVYDLVSIKTFDPYVDAKVQDRTYESTLAVSADPGIVSKVTGLANTAINQVSDQIPIILIGGGVLGIGYVLYRLRNHLSKGAKKVASGLRRPKFRR
jgi:hypothetical protein